jgi:hypothetical protein
MLLIRLEVTSELHALLMVPLRVCYNRSSTTRWVTWTSPIAFGPFTDAAAMML